MPIKASKESIFSTYSLPLFRDSNDNCYRALRFI